MGRREPWTPTTGLDAWQVGPKLLSLDWTFNVCATLVLVIVMIRLVFFLFCQPVSHDLRHAPGKLAFPEVPFRVAAALELHKHGRR